VTGGGIIPQSQFFVTPGLVPGIQVLGLAPKIKTRMAGTSPAMTGSIDQPAPVAAPRLRWYQRRPWLTNPRNRKN
jgi:hypothetical protein